jgi:hypothetical protein
MCSVLLLTMLLKEEFGQNKYKSIANSCLKRQLLVNNDPEGFRDRYLDSHFHGNDNFRKPHSKLRGILLN